MKRGVVARLKLSTAHSSFSEVGRHHQLKICISIIKAISRNQLNNVHIFSVDLQIVIYIDLLGLAVMQGVRELKQQYLRENILDADYDPNDFMDYCESEHGSVDIDQWTLSQLKDIVGKYITAKQTTAAQQEQQDQQDQYAHNIDNNQHDFHEQSVESSKKQGKEDKVLSKEIADQFSSWGNFIDEKPKPPKKQETANIQLNLLDFNFLQSFSGGSPQKKQEVPNKQTVSNQSAAESSNKSKYMSVPGDIAQKLAEGNNNFIIAYNPHNTYSQQKHVTTSPSIKNPPNFNTEKLNNISSNLQSQNPTQTASTSLKDAQTSANNNKNFTAFIETKKVINKSRLTGNQEVVVNNHEIVNPNIFVPKYVLYSFTVNPLNIEVKRRYKDFEMLRQLLVKFFPTTQIPHLERCSRLNETEPTIIKKQTMFLQSFLNNLLLNNQIKSKLVQQFLLCPDLDLLKKIFKQYEKLARPRAIEHLFTTEGQAELKINDENRKFLMVQGELGEYMQEHFSKLKGLYDELLGGFEHNRKTLQQIQNMHSTMKQKIKAANTQFTPHYQCPDLQKTLDRIQQLHKHWGCYFKTQTNVLRSQIRHFYRFESENIKTLSQIVKTQNQINDMFSKRPDKDQAGQQLYKSRRLDPFKHSIDTPSKNITVLKHQAAYYQQHTCDEIMRFLREFNHKSDHRFKLFSGLQLSILHDMEFAWKDLSNSGT